MKQVSIRPAEQADAKNYFDWLKGASSINLSDPAVYSEPTCNTVTVEINKEPVLMTSFRLVLCLEALAPKPGLSPKHEALALRELHEGIKRVAKSSGINEIVFQCIDPRLQAFIEKRGFTRINTPVYRIKADASTKKRKKE